MRISRRPLVLLAIFALALLAAASLSHAASQADEEIAWKSDPMDALAAAEERGRPLLVDTWAVWCAPCIEMDESVWARPEIVEASRWFEALKVDHDIQPIFVDRYRIDALPVILFLDEEGEELARVMGLQSAEDVLALMQRVREGYPSYRAALGDDASVDAKLRAMELLVELGGYERALDIGKRAARAARDAAPRERARLELALGDARLGADDPRRATRHFEEALDLLEPKDTLAASALAGLVRAERARGDDEAAAAALSKLRERFPERAAEL